MALDDLGLVPALRGYLKDYQEKTGLEADLVFFGTDRRFDNAFEVALFRLIQEALANVAKHAQAKRIWVKIDLGSHEVKMSVKDDGRGFEVEKARHEGAGTKFGLVGMRERAELLGGRMDVSSSPGLGTRVSFSVPLPE
jgi:two-component system sensor histidine kinase DegS